MSLDRDVLKKIDKALIISLSLDTYFRHTILIKKEGIFSLWKVTILYGNGDYISADPYNGNHIQHEDSAGIRQ